MEFSELQSRIAASIFPRLSKTVVPLAGGKILFSYRLELGLLLAEDLKVRYAMRKDWLNNLVPKHKRLVVKELKEFAMPDHFAKKLFFNQNEGFQIENFHQYQYYPT